MRTIAPVMVVMALGVAGMMLGMSGFNDAWGAPAPQTSAAQEELNQSAERVDPQETPISGPVSAADSSTVGLIASALGTITDMVAAVVVLPLTLINLGFPPFFAVPLGLLAQLITGVGLIEFAVNREWT